MCASAKNHTLPIIAAAPLKSGRAALKAGFFLSVLAHSVVVGGVLWHDRVESACLDLQGGKGTEVFLVAGYGTAENSISTEEVAARTDKKHDAPHTPEALSEPIQQTMAVKTPPNDQAPGKPLVDTARVEASSLNQSKAVKKHPAPEADVVRVDTNRQKPASKPYAKQRAVSVTTSVRQEAVPDKRRGEAASHRQQKVSRTDPGGGLTSMSAGQASGIGSSQGNGMGEPDRVRFGMDTGPSFVRFSPPEYPAAARRQGISGLVLLRVRISAEGRADRIEVISSADDRLSRSACAAVRNAVFAPYAPFGKAMSCWTEIPIRFRLEASRP